MVREESVALVVDDQQVRVGMELQRVQFLHSFIYYFLSTSLIHSDLGRFSFPVLVSSAPSIQ